MGRHFLAAYHRAYGESPDAQAALNYNALYLYAQAARRAGSAAPDKVMATLYDNFQGDGPFGQARFNELGELRLPALYIKHFGQGRFQPVEAVIPMQGR